VPDAWKEAMVNPVLKTGKIVRRQLQTDSLFSCLCKEMERMVKSRLVCVLESRTLLSERSAGFGATDLLLTTW
jgi:hypothetical protein